MDCWSAFVAGFFLFLWGGGSTVVSGDGFLQCEFPAIYNFGDSNSDTGGIFAAFDSLPLLDREKFIHNPELAGRASDGRLIIDFIAEYLKLPYLSAYLDSLAANFRHGANFATGGSTIKEGNVTMYEYGLSPFFLDVQILQFNRFKARSIQLYSQAKIESDRDKMPRPKDFAKALYTFDIGQNDIYFGMKTMSFDQLRATLPEITNKLASAVQNVYQQGGRAFWIHNARPIGCLPLAVENNPHQAPEYVDELGCVKATNYMISEFNSQLKERVIKLRAELPKAAITYVDIHAAAYALISNAKELGYVDPFKYWYRFQANDFKWCGNKLTAKNSSCEDPLKFISWDGGHYSEAANHWIANHILNGSFSEPPIPITQACHRQASSIDNKHEEL